MHWHKPIPVLLAGAALLAWGAMPAAAAGTSVSYEAVPQQSQVSTGNTVEVSIRCTEAELDPSGVSLTFQVADGYAFSDAQAGSGIQSGEFSYSYRDGKLILLYLDDAGGGSPVTPGEELATVTLVAGQAGTGAPLSCLAVDSAAVDGAGQVVSQQGSLAVDTLTVSGQTVPLPSPTPGGTEEGQPVQPTAAPSTTAKPSTTEKPSATATPSSTSTPSATTRPQTTPARTAAPGGTSGGTGDSTSGSTTVPLPAGSDSSRTGQQASGGQETSPAAGQSTTTGSAPTMASSGSRGTPAPTITTAPNGEVVQVFPAEDTAETVDRTGEVLEAPAATTPQPTESPAVTDTTSDAAPAADALASAPVLPAVAALVLLVLIALGIVVWRRRR